MKRKRKLKRSILNSLLVIIVIIIVLLIINLFKYKPNNDDSIKYKNGKCNIYYPNNEVIQEYAINRCESKEKNTIDYTIDELGDFISINYDNQVFYLNKDYSNIELSITNKDILISELRYQMRFANIEEAYTSKYMLDTNDLDISNLKAHIKDNKLIINIPNYNFDVETNLALAQLLTDTNFNQEHLDYHKQIYINPNRPMVAITYDDGPYKPVDEAILETMEIYDARCTFYYVGNRMGPTSCEYSKVAIEKGFEYGSHSEEHANLSYLSVSDAKSTIKQISNYFEENLNYKMKTYRPPYGSRNTDLEDNIDMVAVLWNCDSRDWANRNAYDTYWNIMNSVDENDVILMHSLYESTASATKNLVPDLMDQGYQLVTVSDLLNYLNLNDCKVFRGN